MSPESALTAADLLARFPFIGVPSAAFTERLARTDTRVRPPTTAEVEDYVLMVLQRTHRPDAARSASENQQAFERGWRENFEAAMAAGLSVDTLRPRYFRPVKYLRYNRGLVVSPNPLLEWDLLTLQRLLVFPHFLAPYEQVYEFGCGSCGNLLLLSDLFPDKQLQGLDWAPAAVDIANLLGTRAGRRCTGRMFDMLHPAAEVTLAPNSAVLTVHAMEQLGTAHEALLQYLLAARPALVVQLEPILELYDPDSNLYDHLAFTYSRQRRYLEGYLPALQRLAASGQIELQVVHRPAIGGVIHEASLLVWRPL